MYGSCDQEMSDYPRLARFSLSTFNLQFGLLGRWLIHRRESGCRSKKNWKSRKTRLSNGVGIVLKDGKKNPGGSDFPVSWNPVKSLKDTFSNCFLMFTVSFESLTDYFQLWVHSFWFLVWRMCARVASKRSQFLKFCPTLSPDGICLHRSTWPAVEQLLTHVLAWVHLILNGSFLENYLLEVCTIRWNNLRERFQRDFSPHYTSGHLNWILLLTQTNGVHAFRVVYLKRLIDIRYMAVLRFAFSTPDGIKSWKGVNTQERGFYLTFECSPQKIRALMVR